MNDVNYVSEFLQYLKCEKKSSSNTVQAYERDIEHFVDYAFNNGLDLLSVETDDVIEYRDNLMQKGLSDSSVSRAMSSVRCYYHYLISCNFKDFNPAKGIKNIKPEKKFFEILTGKEVELLLSRPNIHEPKGIRDKAMLEVLYATGMKVSELISLNLEDFNLQLEYIKCHSEDNAKKERIILLYPIAIRTIESYLNNARKYFVSTNERALFVNVNGERMTRQGFWKILKAYVVQAEINKTITPHTLRHSFAAHLLENGADINDIKEILGHSDISSTQVYAQYLKSKMKSSILKFHPRS